MSLTTDLLSKKQTDSHFVAEKPRLFEITDNAIRLGLQDAAKGQVMSTEAASKIFDATIKRVYKQ